MDNNFKPADEKQAEIGESKFIYKPSETKRKALMSPQKFRILAVLFNGFLAGIMFSLGAVAYLKVNNKYLGSALFTIGLLIILIYGFGFYTSKIGYCLTQKKTQNIMLFPLWVGNVLGAVFIGLISFLTRDDFASTIYHRANEISGLKLSDSSGGILIMSIIGGLLMFVVTDNYQNAKTAAQKYIILFVSVMVMVLCDFEHFVSSTFYFVAAGAVTFKAVWYLLIMTVGNSLGALIIPCGHNLIKLIQQNTTKK